jgi:hypothetical protein
MQYDGFYAIIKRGSIINVGVSAQEKNKKRRA